MKIYGTGIDIVETKRIRTSIQKFGNHFLERIFLPDEIRTCQTMPLVETHLAARFAAKEAISKALGTGIGASLGWKDIEIKKNTQGAPLVVLHGKAKIWTAREGIDHVLVSLSHTANYGAANALAIIH